MLILSTIIAIIEYHVCNGPIGLRQERFKDYNYLKRKKVTKLVENLFSF